MLPIKSISLQVATEWAQVSELSGVGLDASLTGDTACWSTCSDHCRRFGGANKAVRVLPAAITTHRRWRHVSMGGWSEGARAVPDRGAWATEHWTGRKRVESSTSLCQQAGRTLKDTALT